MRGRLVFGEQGAPDRYYIDGKEVTKAEWDRAFPPRPIGTGAGLTAWKRPLKSDALAVHPNQIEQTRERNRKAGVNVDYDPRDGRAVIPDRETRRRLMALEGCHDNDGGYGDQTQEKGGFLDPAPDDFDGV